MESTERTEALLDQIHVAGVARRRCALRLTGPSGAGLLGLDRGEIVHASYAGMAGPAAAFRLVEEGSIAGQPVLELQDLPANMRAAYQPFLVEAIHRLEAGAAVSGSPAGAGGGPVGAGDSPPAELAALAELGRQLALEDDWSDVLPALGQGPAAEGTSPPPVASPGGGEAPAPGSAIGPARADRDAGAPRAPAARRRRRRSRLGPLALTAALALVFAAIGTAALGSRGPAVHQAPGPAPVATTAARDPGSVGGAGASTAAIEASELTGPGDRAPALLSGADPASPDPGGSLAPTIVCRLLVDPAGRVARAELFQRRPDRAAFEEAALVAARALRFEPGRQSGQPVAVWIDWPVQFR